LKDTSSLKHKYLLLLLVGKWLNQHKTLPESTTLYLLAHYLTDKCEYMISVDQEDKQVVKSLKRLQGRATEVLAAINKKLTLEAHVQVVSHILTLDEAVLTLKAHSLQLLLDKTPPFLSHKHLIPTYRSLLEQIIDILNGYKKLNEQKQSFA